MKNTKERLIDFFRDKTNVNVNEDTLLFSDLGYTGLDADLLLEEFVNEFKVNMDKFNYKEYFDSVPLFPFGQYIASIFGRSSRQKKTLSLDDLVEIIERGEWPASAQ